MKALETLQIGVEVTPGTAVTPTLQLPLTGSGFMPKHAGGLGTVRGSTHWPSPSSAEAVGRTASASASIDLNRDNIRDIILLATKRTAGLLPYFTAIHGKRNSIFNTYSGGQLGELVLSFARGSTPDEGYILQAATLSMEFMNFAPATGALASLTAPHASRFKAHQSSITLNSVAQTVHRSIQVAQRNTLALGPIQSTGERAFILPGEESLEVTLAKQFLSGALLGHLNLQTEITGNSVVFATGTANETVTLTIGKAKLASHEDTDDDGVQHEQVIMSPYHTGAAQQGVWTFGSAIGASSLGL